MSAWLRRDIGLTEDIVTSVWDHVDEIRRRHCGWVLAPHPALSPSERGEGVRRHRVVNRARIPFAAAAWHIHASFTQWRLSFPGKVFKQGE